MLRRISTLAIIPVKSGIPLGLRSLRRWVMAESDAAEIWNFLVRVFAGVSYYPCTRPPLHQRRFSFCFASLFCLFCEHCSNNRARIRSLRRQRWCLFCPVVVPPLTLPPPPPARPSKMQLTLLATRPTPRGASHLVQSNVCLVGETPTRSVPAL